MYGLGLAVEEWMLLAGRLLRRQPLQAARRRTRLVGHPDMRHPEGELNGERSPENLVRLSKLKAGRLEMGAVAGDFHARDVQVACVENDGGLGITSGAVDAQRRRAFQCPVGERNGQVQVNVLDADLAGIRE